MSTAYIYTPNTVDIYFTYKTDVILNTHSICYQEKQKQLKLHFWLRSNWFCFPSIHYLLTQFTLGVSIKSHAASLFLPSIQTELVFP